MRPGDPGWQMPEFDPRDEFRVDTYVASVPNPPWEVRVLYVPTGRVRTAAGRGYGYRRAADELIAELRAETETLDRG